MANSARYAIVAARSRWEEQGFHFDDDLPNYGLEQFVYNRLNELGWFRLARQPGRANYTWVLEFYANNAAGEDFSTVRGRRVPATATTINALLDLPDDEPSFYAMLGGFEEEDFEVIKDFLCQPNTEWNTTAEIQTQSAVPASYLKQSYGTRYRVNIGEILANELAAACANDKGVLAFPCLVSALCRRAAVPTFDGDKYQPEKTGWTKAVYMRKMDVADAAPLNMTMPTPAASPVPEADARVEDSAPAAQQRTPPPTPPVIPVSNHTTTTSPASIPAAPTERSREKTPDTPLGSTPSTPPSPSAPAQSEEAALPLPFMLLRSQLQRIEARQIHFQEEMKVFQSNLLKFLHFQFPATAAAQPSIHTSAKEGATEEVHFSSDDENDIFDWQSPRDHLLTLGPVTTTPAPAAPILSAAPTPTTSAVAERPTPDSPARKKGKATAGRTIGRDNPSSPEEEADQRPAKRRRRYHVITADSDDDDSSAELPVPKPMKSANPSLSSSI
ncbi:hypothetical protein V6N11_050070 [Hibiscus sabdariffa]|uniref:Putative plant transposon protein domain-containing protein n=1 Tax=Hibiscus sabdariffa TaxID=183260 RepID=A0ABR2T9F7_9ROSI